MPMSSVFLDCVKHLQDGSGVSKQFKKIDSLENNGKKVTLYLEAGFWPKKGFMIKSDSGSLEGKTLDDGVEYSESLAELTKYLNE